MKRFLPYIILPLAIFTCTFVFGQTIGSRDTAPKPIDEAEVIEVLSPKDNSEIVTEVISAPSDTIPKVLSEENVPKTNPYFKATFTGPSTVRVGESARFTFTATKLENSPKNDFPKLHINWLQPIENSETEPENKNVLADAKEFLKATQCSPGFKTAKDKSISWDETILFGGKDSYVVEYQAMEVGTVDLTVLMTIITPDEIEAIPYVKTVKIIGADEEKEEIKIVPLTDVKPTASTTVEKTDKPEKVEEIKAIPLPPTVLVEPKPGRKISLEQILEIDPIERRVQAMLNFAALQREIYDDEVAESTFEAAIAELDQVDSLETKIRLMGEITQRYQMLKLQNPKRNQLPVHGGRI